MLPYDRESHLRAGKHAPQHLRRVWRERQTLFRKELLSEMYIRTRTCVSLQKGKLGGRGSLSPQGELYLGYLLLSVEQQPSGERKCEEGPRAVANLFPGPEGMYSNNRALESPPYQDLRRVRREWQTLFRLKLLSGAHLRTRFCVSPWQDEPTRGPQYPRGRNLISGTTYPHEGSRPARVRKVGHAAVPPRISSPGWRARSPTIVRSRVANTEIYDAFGSRGKRSFG